MKKVSKRPYIFWLSLLTIFAEICMAVLIPLIYHSKEDVSKNEFWIWIILVLFCGFLISIFHIIKLIESIKLENEFNELTNSYEESLKAQEGANDRISQLELQINEMKKKEAEIKITNSFVQYAEYCKKIVENAKGFIYVVQTPFKINQTEVETNSFSEYTKTTAQKIFQKDGGRRREINDYKRLIIVDKKIEDPNNDSEVLKTQKFLRDIFDYSLSEDIPPDLNNFKIGIIHKKDIPKYFFSNMEILITDSPCHAIAFQKCIDINKFKWSSSIYFSPNSNGQDVDSLKVSFEKIWDNEKDIEICDFNKEYNHLQNDKEKIKKEQERIINLVVEKMKLVAKKYA